MSSSAPNLQQIPSRSELAKTIRSIFIPDEGHSHWASLDYASVESRVLAHHAVGTGADELRAQYNQDPYVDYHNFTIGLVKKVTGFTLPRAHAKMINFGLCYGASEKKLSKMLGITKEESDPLFEAFHTGLPYVRETMEAMSREVSQNGYITTILGRRSHFDYYEPMNGERGEMPLPFEAALSRWGTRIRRAYLHKAGNHRIQGDSAELTKAALVKCWDDGIFDVTSVPRLIVHDSLEMSVGEDTKETREGFYALKNAMETAIKFRVPIRADGKWGNNWSNLYPLYQ